MAWLAPPGAERCLNAAEPCCHPHLPRVQSALLPQLNLEPFHMEQLYDALASALDSLEAQQVRPAAALHATCISTQCRWH